MHALYSTCACTPAKRSKSESLELNSEQVDTGVARGTNGEYGLIVRERNLGFSGLEGADQLGGEGVGVGLAGRVSDGAGDLALDQDGGVDARGDGWIVAAAMMTSLASP